MRELLAPYLPPDALDDPLVARILAHLDLLVRWNQHMNLTALRNEEEMVTRHFGESLFAAAQLFSRDATGSLFDVGSGAGFPGLPMKFWAPGLEVTLIEAHGKKATFLREVSRAVNLPGLTVLNSRAEDVQAQAATVTLRAVEKFEAVLPLAHRLIAPGGKLAILIGDAQREKALELLPEGASSFLPLPGSESRILLRWRARG
ncbi:MAG: 16S rRNA (guanine(527)-N(7))-methyltransferase RsmG [Acidobacteriota bacterium]|nr:16S rRNA (guanine(527)-N(7))-methyltransferase RsmG [Acidobacteriota bacterium]